MVRIFEGRAQHARVMVVDPVERVRIVDGVGYAVVFPLFAFSGRATITGTLALVGSPLDLRTGGDVG